MIFKGFTDENGNVIPVQGAGTVYDEEKNSLALGKDTVAIGQDQLVFGRKNVQDANKVEIVGGGCRAIDLNQEELGCDITGYYSQITTENNIYYGGRSISDLKTALSVVIGVEKDAITGLDDSSFYDKDFFIIAKFTRQQGGYNLGIFAHGYSSANWYDSSSFTPVTDLPESIEIKKLNSTPNVVAKNDADTILAAYTVKNIRTLDWEGNEELAGSLTVGTGITIGETSLTEEQLIALKALLNS